MNSIDGSEEKIFPPKGIVQRTKVYKRRWVILLLYILYAAINAFQWFEYSIITNIIMKYYNISSVAVDWTSIIYMALYMPMVIPVSYLMEKLDLRQIAIIGVTGTFLGTTIKLLSLNQDRMWVTYLCQTILSSMQVFILALPPRIAAVWFGPKEISFACAFGVFGTQLGQAIGFVVPPIVIQDHGEIETIEDELRQLIKWLAIFTTIVTIVVYASRPPLPPNQVNIIKEDTNYFKSLKILLMDKSFSFLAVAYGINIAVFTSISTLLNQFMLSYFKNSEEDAGRIGLLMVTLGMVGAIIFSIILDKTHAYKKTTFLMYLASLIAVLLFMFFLESRSKLLVYIAGGLVGLFINAYMPIGLELAVELTYPEPESTTSGILISMTQTLGVIFTLLLGSFFSRVGCFWALASMAFALFIGVILTGLIENRTKRQDAFKWNACRTTSNNI